MTTPEQPTIVLAGASWSAPTSAQLAASGTLLAPFTCRLDHDIEEGEVILPPIAGPDWTGKRPYRTVKGDLVYLFPDEVDHDAAIWLCVHGCPIVIDPSEIADHAAWHEATR